ncbi:MAG: hypothetical protein O7G84_08585 [Gammaproteobacteria bacterium]|nr:hypothetical protein [Gammaproteobacteria bacterium]
MYPGHFAEVAPERPAVIAVVMIERFDPVESLRCIRDHHVTHSQWVPTMLSRMLKLPEFGERRIRALCNANAMVPGIGVPGTIWSWT